MSQPVLYPPKNKKKTVWLYVKCPHCKTYIVDDQRYKDLDPVHLTQLIARLQHHASDMKHPFVWKTAADIRYEVWSKDEEKYSKQYLAPEVPDRMTCMMPTPTSISSPMQLTETV